MSEYLLCFLFTINENKITIHFLFILLLLLDININITKTLIAINNIPPSPYCYILYFYNVRFPSNYTISTYNKRTIHFYYISFVKIFSILCGSRYKSSLIESLVLPEYNPIFDPLWNTIFWEFFSFLWGKVFTTYVYVLLFYVTNYEYLSLIYLLNGKWRHTNCR